MQEARGNSDTNRDSCAKVPSMEQSSLVSKFSRQSATVTSAASSSSKLYESTFTLSMPNVAEPFQVQAICLDERFDRIKDRMPPELEAKATATVEKMPYWTNVKSVERLITLQFLPKNVHGTAAYEACLKHLRPDRCGLVKLGSPSAPFMWLLRQKLQIRRHVKFYEAIRDMNPKNRTEFLIGLVYTDELPAAMPSTSQSGTPAMDATVPEASAPLPVVGDETTTTEQESSDGPDSSQESDDDNDSPGSNNHSICKIQ